MKELNLIMICCADKIWAQPLQVHPGDIKERQILRKGFVRSGSSHSESEIALSSCFYLS